MQWHDTAGVLREIRESETLRQVLREEWGFPPTLPSGFNYKVNVKKKPASNVEKVKPQACIQTGERAEQH